MISTRKDRRGFTLVEILVVVLIIMILMGFPAIQAARENGRTTQCINNQQELGKAIAQYEMAKNRLPGVLSFVNPSAPTTSLRINWVISIFGELGRMDLWQAYSSGTGPGPVKVSQLVCPSNGLVNPVGGLSYAVNWGVYQPDPASGNPDYSVRLFRNRGSWDAAAVSPLPQTESDQTMTSLRAPNRTVMLSEKLQPSLWTWVPDSAILFKPGSFVAQTPPTDLSPLAFQWPAAGSASKITDLPPGLGSNHRGMINITFCDGHTEKIPETTTCWQDPDNQLIGTP
jgi:prepilin-type N-terminal cleavage/methylation domain-containing protein/prepilin-type processing-associated H-X9-DG protein